MAVPNISIIMPTYNRAAFIGESIESVRQQTYTDWELIVVDDGSDDDTEEIVQSIGDDRIRFYKAGRIGIGGKIKNIGLSKARGEFVAFLDSDDLWSSTKLEKQLAALKQFEDSGFCVSGGYNFKALDKPVDYFYGQRQGVNYGDFFLAFFNSALPGFTQALLLRKGCLEKTGHFREVKAFSDVDFIATLAYHFNGVILYEPLVFRRLHDASYSNPVWVKSYYEGVQLIHDFKDKLPADVFRSAMFRLYVNFGEDYLRVKKRLNATGKFFKAWTYKPFSIVPMKKTGKAALRLLRNK